MHQTTLERPWGKSRTAKRYLHPPYAEEIVTLWPNTVVMIGEIESGSKPQHDLPGRQEESVLPSCAMAFLYKNRLLPAGDCIFATRADGIPIHAQIQKLGKLTLSTESFCNTERIPTAYTRAVVTNETAAAVTDKLTLIARTAPEFDLLGVREPDGYYKPEPTVNRWLIHERWTQTPEMLTDGTYSLAFHTPEEVAVNDRDPNFVHFNFTLQPGESLTFDFAFRRGEAECFSYEEEKEKTTAFWRGELEKLRLYPGGDKAMISSLVAQILQMFCHPRGVEYTLLRQGGLQRLSWPTEARSAIRALARLGDFDSYIDSALNTYFHVMQKRNGQIVNFGIPWGSVTGSVLFAFGASALYSRELYEKYREQAYLAFRWNERQRQISKDTPGYASGLFPPVRSSDYRADGQIWAETDGYILEGYLLYVRALKKWEDPHAEEAAAALADYQACLRAVFDRVAEAQREQSYLRVPVDARLDPQIEEIMQKMVFSETAVLRLISVGATEPKSEAADKMLRYHFEVCGNYENGLTQPFAPSEAGEGRQWYGSFLDSELYYIFRARGEDSRAKEILDAQLNYMMTDEYYMSERYDDHDPEYFPWCPNCSANGRTLTMLCDWYLDRPQVIADEIHRCTGKDFIV